MRIVLRSAKIFSLYAWWMADVQNKYLEYTSGKSF